MSRPATRAWVRLQSQSALSISSLPSEVLHRVAEILDATHPRSLVAFAQTSKRLYAVASRFLFSTLKFTPLTDGKLLAKDVETWERILFRDGALQYVRRLILHWDGLYDGTGPLHSPYLSLKQCERSDSDTNLETCWDLYDEGWCGGNQSGIKEHEWAPLARLLKKLTGLADFIFADPGPFPSSFLQILHDQASRCRLHHYTFSLSTSDEASLRADERLLITSPCLFTIGDLSAIISYSYVHVESMLLARRNAPSLRRVFSFCHGPKRLTDYGCDADDVYNLPSIPALEYLQISSFFDMYWQRWRRPFSESLTPKIIDWNVLNGCNALRVLKLNTPMRDQTLPAPSNFPSLVTLSVVCPRNSPTPAWSDSFLALLRGLPNLKALRVFGWPRSTSFTPGLNTGLQKLHLDTWHTPGGPPLLQDHVLQLPVMCPALEELTIEIKRSRGDAAEVARYRALGRLPRLRRLKLSLDAVPPAIIPDDIVEVPSRGQGPWKPYYPWPGHTNVEPWFEDGWDSEEVSWGLAPHRNGHVRDVLVNSAIDSALALSIFGVINAAKSDLKLVMEVQPLERVELLANRSFLFPQSLPERPYPGFNGPVASKLAGDLDLVARNWVIERDVRDDSRDKIHVREIDRVDGIQRADDVFSVSDQFLEVWQRVWPAANATDGGVAWRKQWQSWPLDLSSAEKE